jgi:hypothetical protein
VWLLARAKLKGGRKFYGAYPGGYPERARMALGVHIDDPVLHVCSGCIRWYPYARAFGPNDKTLDLDPALEPDYLQCATAPYPAGFAAVLCDPPYSPEDAKRYAPGAAAYPAPNAILRRGLEAVEIGRRVGILHYVWPAPPRATMAKEVFVAAVGTGRNGRARWYTVWERLS